MTNRDRLITLARALYGERWQLAVARDLGKDHKQVRRWASGEYEPPTESITKLVDVASKRISDIAKAIATTGEF